MVSPQQMTLAVVIDLVRSGKAVTRPELERVSGLGRTVVNQRVATAIALGLMVEDSLSPSTGGRAPRQLRFRSEAGLILVADIGASGMTLAVCDLSAALLEESVVAIDIADGPEPTLSLVESQFDELLNRIAAKNSASLWGIGVALPGPVEFASGRPVAPPIMPGWDGYDVRQRLSQRYGVPVWVDNDVNLMALGELRNGIAHDVSDVVMVKVGTGIGAGLVSSGHLHRGAQGCAGDIGHVEISGSSVLCRCGKRGCLEASAGGAAIEREARKAASTGESPYLRDRLASTGSVTGEDVGQGAALGDGFCADLLDRSAQEVGQALSMLVNFYNPSQIVVAGAVARTGDRYLARVREEVYRRSLPLATRAIHIAPAQLGEQAGVVGAAHMVVEELLAPETLERWQDASSPAGMDQLAAG